MEGRQIQWGDSREELKKAYDGRATDGHGGSVSQGKRPSLLPALPEIVGRQYPGSDGVACRIRGHRDRSSRYNLGPDRVHKLKGAAGYCDIARVPIQRQRHGVSDAAPKDVGRALAGHQHQADRPTAMMR